MVVGSRFRRRRGRLCCEYSRGGVVIFASLGWRSFVVSRKEVRRRRRRMCVVFRGLVWIVLGKVELNDPVFLRQEMRRSGH